MSKTEIRFRNDQTYFLKPHGMTSEIFENQIKTFRYAQIYEKYKRIKDENGVEKGKFPAVNIVFYKSIFDRCQVVSPENFFKEYLDFYKDQFAVSGSQIKYNQSVFDYDAFEGRILRTYPSLIRDFDFYLLLCESHKFEQVIYSCSEDINGKDIIIKHEGKERIVSLFTDTNRSNFYKNIKNRFRHEYSDNEIQMPIDLNKARKCGDFMLYSKKDINIIVEHFSFKKNSN